MPEIASGGYFVKLPKSSGGRIIGPASLEEAKRIAKDYQGRGHKARVVRYKSRGGRE